MPETTVEVAAKLPGESLAVAIMNYMTTFRASMSQANRDRMDALLAAAGEGWHNWCVEHLAWPGKKIE